MLCKERSWILNLFLNHQEDFCGPQWTTEYKGGTPQKTELSSRGWAPCSTGLPHYVSVLGTQLCQCTSWHCCERLCLASVNFFWRLFQCVYPFIMGGLQAPACTALSVQQFLTKNGMTPCPTLPFQLILPEWLFFCFPGGKNSSKGNVLLMRSQCGRGETKNSKSIKRHQKSMSSKTVLSSGKKHLDRCIASNGEYFEGDWSLNM